MSKARHTPGPWQLCYGGLPGDDGFSIASKINREVVCERWPCTCDNNDRERMTADATLIAAAPELLEMLVEIVAGDDAAMSALEMSFQVAFESPLTIKARSLIAKATGASQ